LGVEAPAVTPIVWCRLISAGISVSSSTRNAGLPMPLTISARRRVLADVRPPTMTMASISAAIRRASSWRSEVASQIVFCTSIPGHRSTRTRLIASKSSSLNVVCATSREGESSRSDRASSTVEMQTPPALA